MLDNEFDQIFRDRLLDHPSKIRLSLWKQVHTHLLRHKALHFWKWYFVGPSAVVVAVTGYIVIATLHSSSHNKQKAPVAAVATYEARPAADSPATTAAQANPGTQSITAPDSPAATANPNSIPAGATPTASTPGAAVAKTPAPGNATAATNAAAAANAAATNAAATAPAAATNAAAATSSTTRPSAASASLRRSPATTHTAHRNTHSANDLTAHSRSATTTNTHRRHLSNAHNKKASDAMANDANEGNDAGDARTANRANGANGANRANGANDARSPNSTTGAHNTRPTRGATQPAAPVKLIALKTPAVVTAKTPNSKSPHQLIVPAPRPRTHIPFNVDLFGAPEYFTWKTIGLSYGAGARVTVIFKDHWTITSGLQYQRINVNHVKNLDSLNGLLPGYFTNFHIPLFLGYTTGNDRFSFTVNAGVLFSLYTQANGSLSQADNWSNHNGINSYLGLNFSSHITNRVSLFAEPYLKCWYPPGDQRLPPQLWSTGIIVGFRYKF